MEISWFDVLLLAACLVSLGVSIGLLAGYLILNHRFYFLQNAVLAHEDIIAGLCLKTGRKKDIPHSTL